MPVPKHPQQKNRLPAPGKSQVPVRKIHVSRSLARIGSIPVIARANAQMIPVRVVSLFPALACLALST